MNRSLKILKLANASLAHMVRHWSPKPAIISCTRSSSTGGNLFFAVVKSFEYKLAISANFVQTQVLFTKPKDSQIYGRSVVWIVTISVEWKKIF